MLKFSKHNIVSAIRNSDKYFIINLLTGNADILNSEEFEKVSSLQSEGKISVNDEFESELAAKGYLIDEEDEKKLYNIKYADFLDNRDNEEVQLFFVTNYSCNFKCSYCYQDQYANPETPLSREVIDSFFNHITSTFSGRKKYITLFGGEPLLPGEKHKQLIEYILQKASANRIQVCVVTNGYSLTEYIDILKKAEIREVQVTLDGTETIHNSRRALKSGGATFGKIVEGIDAALANSMPVNLRMVVDKENIENIADLAAFAIDKGWTENSLFKTQAGRNYELHHCQSSPDKLFDRLSLYESLSEITRKHPHVLQFYKPAYSIARFLSENGSLPEPLFDSCPACKTEWAFDFTGKIYPCTATVGKSDESIGTFYPVKTQHPEKINSWEMRDVTSIGSCHDCNLQLACGGGCGSVAKNRTGNTCSSDCRPVKELLELGFASYFPSN